MINFDKDHKGLVAVLFIGFVVLSFGVAIVPAYQMQDAEPLPQEKPMTKKQRKGLETYIGEGCVACHSQQVRNIEMDERWGGRPTVPSDYFYSKKRMGVWRQSPSLLGSERTGPDLTEVGERQPSKQWHLLHLYNPRSVVEASVMPAYPWLFEKTTSPDSNDVVVGVPDEFKEDTSFTVVASEEAMNLVAYLLSLKQTEMGGQNPVEFIPSKKQKVSKKGPESGNSGGKEGKINGKALFASTCASCHRNDGEGLKGAFPPLKDSKIVNDEDPEMLIKVMLKGYDARDEYAVMPPFGDQLSDEQIAAIANHERTSWGNSAPKVTVEQVKKIRESAKSINQGS